MSPPTPVGNLSSAAQHERDCTLVDAYAVARWKSSSSPIIWRQSTSACIARAQNKQSLNRFLDSVEGRRGARLVTRRLIGRECRVLLDRGDHRLQPADEQNLLGSHVHSGPKFSLILIRSKQCSGVGARPDARRARGACRGQPSRKSTVAAPCHTWASGAWLNKSQTARQYHI